MKIFTAIYFVAIVVEIIIRAPINQKRKQEKMSEQRSLSSGAPMQTWALIGRRLWRSAKSMN